MKTKNSLTNNGIRIYNSFEEAEKGEQLLSKQKNAIEGLRETIDLIARVYGFTREELDAMKMKRKITIVKHEKYFK